MDKKRVLFVCVHNSARSQMAEALLNHLAGDRFEAESAGLEPGVLNPLAVSVMKEIGIDISQNKTKSVFDLFKRGELFSYVITVCDAASAEACPIFPGLLSKTIHWSFEDPYSFTGTLEEKLEKTRRVRDAIKEKIEEWLKELKT
ncbi:MAG TPA: arsenate reductase ArsC [Syntrophorhabdaceae bacterium]|nr:arsenate reductase ArsC [Syntrophorhabdaceae bacterium]HOL05245.1 arsenate reductase ArsC [Syntrophorhabdaceae bacterium]HON84828.1 arsenate reductase ArsC [Syntrophorhabdaceae bacterium]HOT41911.1 arsenate reductase ArsC [Syntrophorhabdaceae bacterium]HPC66406.1 arsenate reductase ArsC [Syntrophorhabdaceae bacterium]